MSSTRVKNRQTLQYRTLAIISHGLYIFLVIKKKILPYLGLKSLIYNQERFQIKLNGACSIYILDLIFTQPQMILKDELCQICNFNTIGFWASKLNFMCYSDLVNGFVMGRFPLCNGVIVDDYYKVNPSGQLGKFWLL